MTTAIERQDDARSQRMKGAFDVFRKEIDEYNDRRERLIKVSRDVTTASKRMIFHLHRYPHSAFAKTSQSGSAADKIVKDAISKRDEIVAIIRKAAQDEGLYGQTPYDQTESPIARAQRHDRAYGPGLEEFVSIDRHSARPPMMLTGALQIEGVSFLHFLQSGGELISLDEVQDLLRSDAGSHVVLPITPQRYLLGISDLTGELMRFATNALGAGAEGQQVVTRVLTALRDIAGAMDPFLPLVYGLRKKQTVTLQSLRKIEDLSYAVKVRTSEFASDQKALQEMFKRALASSSSSGGRTDFEANEEEDR